MGASSKPGSRLGLPWIISIILLILLVASWSYFLIYARQPQQQIQLATRPDTLVIAMDISDAVSMDPAVAYEFTSVMVVNQLYDKLVDFEPPDLTRVVPEVAESWNYSPDGTLWTFKIREGIKFANGDPLTAKDVEYSLRRVLILSKTAAWLLQQFIAKPEDIVATDNYTLTIKLKEKVAPDLFLSVLAFTTSGVVNPREAEAHASGNDMGSGWLTDHSAGSGPYILEKWDRNSEIVLRANPNYWRGPPSIKTIIIKHVPEPATQMLLLQKGDVDIAFGLTIDQIQQLKNVKGIRILEYPVLQLAYIGMNVNNTYLSNEKVRTAIKYAIDYDGIIRDILKGGAMKVQTIIPYPLLGFNPATPYYRDVNKAKQLLAEAGYPNGFDIELAYPAGAHPQEEIAQKIQRDLAEVGIRVTLRPMASAEMYQKYRQQSLQLVLAGWGSDYPDPDNNAKAFGDYRIKQLAWRNMWYDDEVADLVEKAYRELDRSTREALYKQITDYILEHGPYAVLYQVVQYVAMRTWVENFVPDPSFGTYLDLSRIYKEPVLKE
ncbi:MAG: ABC transporter substrate-binding protein [Desulfurococcaceae archaeon]|nr:ABC transporter substrate-binding protein [Desulfurococcaceae archaeon]